MTLPANEAPPGRMVRKRTIGRNEYGAPLLPAKSPSAGHPGGPLPRWNNMKTRPVILVVDDELLLRMLAIEVAEEAGFEVLSAASADEAIVVLEARGDVRLVFTDIRMPGSMDGLRLAHAVRHRWPPVELIVTSGHRLVDADQLPERGRFVAKPYDVAALCRTFHEMTGSAPG